MFSKDIYFNELKCYRWPDTILFSAPIYFYIRETNQKEKIQRINNKDTLRRFRLITRKRKTVYYY